MPKKLIPNDNNNLNSYIKTLDLRQSAIEDIIGLRKYHSLITKGRNIGYSIFIHDDIMNRNDAIISYIKMKFNITEEDIYDNKNIYNRRY